MIIIVISIIVVIIVCIYIYTHIERDVYIYIYTHIHIHNHTIADIVIVNRITVNIIHTNINSSMCIHIYYDNSDNSNR